MPQANGLETGLFGRVVITRRSPDSRPEFAHNIFIGPIEKRTNVEMVAGSSDLCEVETLPLDQIGTTLENGLVILHQEAGIHGMALSASETSGKQIHHLYFGISREKVVAEAQRKLAELFGFDGEERPVIYNKISRQEIQTGQGPLSIQGTIQFHYV